MRAMRAAVALAGVASMMGCARPDAPVARPVAPGAIVDVAPTTTTTAAPVTTAAPAATAPSAHVGGSVLALRPNDPLNDMSLMTNLELVIDGKTGKLVKQAVIRTSGLVGFDALTLDAVTRAAPFEPAAPALWSSDGNVYVHWEFRRDPVFGCSTMHVWPFLLDVGSPTP